MQLKLNIYNDNLIFDIETHKDLRKWV